MFCPGCRHPVRLWWYLFSANVDTIRCHHCGGLLYWSKWRKIRPLIVLGTTGLVLAAYHLLGLTIHSIGDVLLIVTLGYLLYLGAIARAPLLCLKREEESE